MSVNYIPYYSPWPYTKLWRLCQNQVAISVEKQPSFSNYPDSSHVAWSGSTIWFPKKPPWFSKSQWLQILCFHFTKNVNSFGNGATRIIWRKPMVPQRGSSNRKQQSDFSGGGHVWRCSRVIGHPKNIGVSNFQNPKTGLKLKIWKSTNFFVYRFAFKHIPDSKIATSKGNLMCRSNVFWF